MGFFGFGKKRDVIDLGERYRKQQERLAEMKQDSPEQIVSTGSGSSDNSGAFGFLGSMASASSSTPSHESDSSENSSYSQIDEKRRAITKKLLDMTGKMEDLSNQIYHLQQRLEVLERKAGVGRY